MKRTNVIMMVSVGICLLFFMPVLFSQEETSGRSAQDKRVASEAPLDAETPQVSKDKVDIKSDTIEKAIPSYRMRLKDILKEAEENIKRVDKEIKEQEVLTRNREREAKVMQAFEAGNQLYKEGKLKEAQIEWDRAISVAKDPEMKKYIEEADRRASEEDRRIKEEEKRRLQEEQVVQKRLEAEAKEKARQERDRLEAERIESEKRAKEEAQRLEAQQREKARLERESARKLEAEQKEKARLEKEAAKKLEAEARIRSEARKLAAREKGRLEREAKRKQKEEALRLEKEAREKARLEKKSAKKSAGE